MLLTNEEIKAEHIVKSANEANFSATSYDLSTGSIIDHTGEDFGAVGYCIKPQEIVWIVSKERVKIPPTITAHAMIRTALCNKGLLALNIGIVDPGWDGPIATTIVNFSKSPYFLTPRENFLRLSFLRHNEPKDVKFISRGSHEYMTERRKFAVETFGSTFLNVSQIADEVRGKLLSKFTERLVVWGSTGAAILGFLAVFIALCTYIFPVRLIDSNQQIEELQKRLVELELTVRENNQAPPGGPR